ncbi:MAG: 50S ribosomal protein L23 [Puniceicoccales bacterium]|nr:50S ribosomal protein L23 [Puniceicoccales bacterium]
MERAKNVLKTFRLTEKTSLLSSAFNCYTFEVDLAASKRQIAAAVRDVFGVRPLSVRTILQKGKLKRHRSVGEKRPMPIRRPNFRKAFVTLVAGDKIEVL